MWRFSRKGRQRRCSRWRWRWMMINAKMKQKHKVWTGWSQLDGKSRWDMKIKFTGWMVGSGPNGEFSIWLFQATANSVASESKPIQSSWVEQLVGSALYTKNCGGVAGQWALENVTANSRRNSSTVRVCVSWVSCESINIRFDYRCALRERIECGKCRACRCRWFFENSY